MESNDRPTDFLVGETQMSPDKVGIAPGFQEAKVVRRFLHARVFSRSNPVNLGSDSAVYLIFQCITGPRSTAKTAEAFEDSFWGSGIADRYQAAIGAARRPRWSVACLHPVCGRALRWRRSSRIFGQHARLAEDGSRENAGCSCANENSSSSGKSQRHQPEDVSTQRRSRNVP
jgi:hypothetical protein